MQGFSASSFAVAAFSVAAFALSPIDVSVVDPVVKVQHSSAASTASLRSLALRKERERLAKHNLLRLQQDDQFATDFIIALVTKGFLNVYK